MSISALNPDNRFSPYSSISNEAGENDYDFKVNLASSISTLVLVIFPIIAAFFLTVLLFPPLGMAVTLGISLMAGTVCSVGIFFACQQIFKKLIPDTRKISDFTDPIVHSIDDYSKAIEQYQINFKKGENLKKIIFDATEDFVKAYPLEESEYEVLKQKIKESLEDLVQANNLMVNIFKNKCELILNSIEDLKTQCADENQFKALFSKMSLECEEELVDKEKLIKEIVEKTKGKFFLSNVKGSYLVNQLSHGIAKGLEGEFGVLWKNWNKFNTFFVHLLKL